MRWKWKGNSPLKFNLRLISNGSSLQCGTSVFIWRRIFFFWYLLNVCFIFFLLHILPGYFNWSVFFMVYSLTSFSRMLFICHYWPSMSFRVFCYVLQFFCPVWLMKNSFSCVNIHLSKIWEDPLSTQSTKSFCFVNLSSARHKKPTFFVQKLILLYVFIAAKSWWKTPFILWILVFSFGFEGYN